MSEFVTVVVWAFIALFFFGHWNNSEAVFVVANDQDRWTDTVSFDKNTCHTTSTTQVNGNDLYVFGGDDEKAPPLIKKATFCNDSTFQMEYFFLNEHGKRMYYTYKDTWRGWKYVTVKGEVHYQMNGPLGIVNRLFEYVEAKI
ncbi:MAG: hypothetical protein ACRCUJ_12850 [Phocaeicola sp.]